MGNIIPISIWPRGLINCFLIKGPQKHILVDTGIPHSAQKILTQLQQHHIDPKDIGLIIVTHAHIDHFGSAATLKQLLKVPILAHDLDVPYYQTGLAATATMKPNKPQWWLFKQLIKNQSSKPFEVDIVLKGHNDYDLKAWGIDGKVVHTPGHTPGSLSILLENGEVIIMDMMASGILLGGVIWHSRIKHPAFHDDLKVLKTSFERILSEKGSCYYLGHGGPVNRGQVEAYYVKYLGGELPRH